MMRLELACLVALLGVVAAEKCGICHVESCKKPVDCIAGLALDKCSCCEECAKSEFEMCDMEDTPHEEMKYGRCGENLNCRLRTDLRGERQEALCYCKDTNTEDEYHPKIAMCGDDDVTYKSMCAVKAASRRTGRKIKIMKEEPCEKDPVILSPPENMKNKIGEEVTLSCEASGFPIPTIEWAFTRVGGKFTHMPNDDNSVSTNQRGGPEKNQITGWLQIKGLRKEHEGDYTCIAHNVLNTKQARGRVIVVDEDDEIVKDEN